MKRASASSTLRRGATCAHRGRFSCAAFTTSVVAVATCAPVASPAGASNGSTANVIRRSWIEYGAIFAGGSNRCPPHQAPPTTAISTAAAAIHRLAPPGRRTFAAG